MRFSKVCAFVAAAMVAVVGRSADYVWNSSVAEGEWSDAKNWLVDGVVPENPPNEDDTVNFEGVSATVLLSDNVAVNAFTGISNGANVILKSSDGKQHGFSVKSFPGAVDETGILIFDGINLFPNYHTLNNDRWGLNTNPVKFEKDCKLVARNGGSINFGAIVIAETLHLVAERGGKIWCRQWGYSSWGNGGNVNGLYLTLDNGRLESAEGHDTNGFTVHGDAYVTIKGADSQLRFSKASPSVSGTLTFHIELPESPYTTPPIRNKTAIDFVPIGKVVVEIDENSPAFKSGVKQTYRIFGWYQDKANGIRLEGIDFPELRTSEEVFTPAWMEGASTSGYPQYVDVLIDGTYNPDETRLDATFHEAYPLEGKMCFSGKILDFGFGASEAIVRLEYGKTLELGESVDLGKLTETGSFEFLFDGLDNDLYYYRLVVDNGIGGEVSSDVSTCSLICGTVLASSFSLVSENGIAVANGKYAIFGSGETSLQLFLSRDKSVWDKVAELYVAEKPSDGTWSIPFKFSSDGVWYAKVVYSNVYGESSWSGETGIADCNVQDKLTYTWKKDASIGSWLDASNWECSGSGIGFPTSASSVRFEDGSTNIVELSSDISVASLAALPSNASITFKGSGFSLIAPNLTASGENSTLTLDGVVFSDNANFWSTNKDFGFGKNSILRLRNRATLMTKSYNPGAGFVLDIAGESLVQLRESRNANASSIIIDDSTLEIPDRAFKFSSITFRGFSPAVKVYSLAKGSAPTKLVYELPEKPYEKAPLRQCEKLSRYDNLNSEENAFEVSVVSDCPARVAKVNKTYKLIDWSRSADHGMNASSFMADTTSPNKLKAGETLNFSRKDGAVESVGYHYLSVTLATSRGMMVIMR